MSETRWHHLTDVYDSVQASILQEALEAHGIPVKRIQEGVRDVIPFSFGKLAKIEIYVAEEKLQEARDWLAQSENEEIPVIDDESEENEE
jgi:hypothetical protein